MNVHDKSRGTVKLVWGGGNLQEAAGPQPNRSYARIWAFPLVAQNTRAHRARMSPIETLRAWSSSEWNGISKKDIENFLRK